MPRGPIRSGPSRRRDAPPGRAASPPPRGLAGRSGSRASRGDPHRRGRSPDGGARCLAAHGGPARLLTDGTAALDRFTDADVGAVWAGEDDQFVRRSCLPGPFTRRDIVRRIGEWQRRWRVCGPTRSFAVRDATTGRLVGGCVLEIGSAGRQSAELSYWVYPRYRGRGYATRAARLACAYAFHDLRLARVVLHIEPSNEASLGVAVAAGFARRRGRGDARWPGMVVLSRRRRGGLRIDASLPCVRVTSGTTAAVALTTCRRIPGNSHRGNASGEGCAVRPAPRR